MKRFPRTGKLPGLALLLVAVCGSAAFGAETLAISNYDSSGQTYEQVFSAPPRRVVAVNGSATENLLRLGLEKHLIGTAYLDNPVREDLRAAYESIPVLSPVYPGKELVLSLEPDFIYGWGTAFAPQALGDVRYWNGLGVKTFIAGNSVLRPRRVANFYEDLLNLGRIFQVEDRAEALVAQSRRDIDHIAATIPPDAPRPGTALLEAASGGLFRAWGDESLAGDMLALAGGENVFSRDGLISLEELLAADPEAIVLIYMTTEAQGPEETMAAMRAHPIMGGLAAVKNGRVHAMPLAETYCAGVRIPDGIRRLAAFLHPELFDETSF